MKWLNRTLRNILTLVIIMMLAGVMVWLVGGQSRPASTAQSGEATPTAPNPSLPSPTTTPSASSPTPQTTTTPALVPTETLTPTLTSTPSPLLTPTPSSPPLTPIRTTPYLAFAATPEPGPTYTPQPIVTPTPTPVPAVTVVSDGPLLSPDLLALVTPGDYRAVWVEAWPVVDDLILRVGYPPDTALWTVTKKEGPAQQNSTFASWSTGQIQAQQIPDQLSVDEAQRQQRLIDQVRRITSPDEPVDYGGFSPNGEWVAWGRYQSLQNETFLIKHLGTDAPPIPLLGPVKYERYEGFLWSPDNTKIAYEVNNGNKHRHEIRISDLAGQQIGLVPLIDLSHEMAWSPDGEYLAFKMPEKRQSGLNQIYLVRADGSGLTQLTSHGLAGGNIHWSPTGNGVTYSYYEKNGDISPWFVAVASEE